MKAKDVQLGGTYVVKVSGKLTRVRLDSESPYGGWVGTNLQTKHQVRIKTAAKLRRPVLVVPKVFDAPDVMTVRPITPGEFDPEAQS